VWAGNEAHNAVYTDAEAQWVVPYASGGSGTDSSHWVGVGQGPGCCLGDNNPYPVVQAGSESPGWNKGSYAWIEVYPQQSEVPLSQLYSIQGDLLFAHVRFTPGLASFHVVDETLGITYQFQEGYPGIRPDGHAEFIAERPSNSSGHPYCLANFGTMRFNSAQAAAGGHWYPIGKLSHFWLWMQNGSHRLAAPGAIDSTGYSFPVTWQNYC
jgi:Peptidase A4 family